MRWVDIRRMNMQLLEKSKQRRVEIDAAGYFKTDINRFLEERIASREDEYDYTPISESNSLFADPKIKIFLNLEEVSSLEVRYSFEYGEYRNVAVLHDGREITVKLN